MKNSKLIISITALVGLTASLNAATILNSSFEADVNPDATGRFSFGESRDFGANGAADAVQLGDENLTNWTAVTTENVPANSGQQISVGFINIAPSAGAQVLALMSGASISQFTSVAWNSLSAGDTITMTVAVGDRTNAGAPNWADQSFFAIIDTATTGTLDSGNLLSSTVANSGALATPFSGGLGINSGTMQDRNFSYTVLASDLSRAGNIGVLLAAYGQISPDNNGLGSSNNQAFFDNVRLAVVPIPEPSAAVLGGLGVLALLRRRRN
jgi:hypothetical protein